MNMKTYLVLFFIFFLLFGSAKNGCSQIYDANGIIVAFHPSVGNAIDLSEKKELNLFPEYNDSLFESAQLIKYSNDRYALLFKTTKGGSFEKPITIKELDEIYFNIEKVKPSAKSSSDDYVDNKASKKSSEKRENRSENVQIAAEITLQIIFVFLEILANSY